MNRLSFRFLPLLLALLLTVPDAAARAGPAPSDTANVVWGQPNFVSRNCRHPSAVTFCGPAQTAIDAQGNLWVTDFINNRVLLYPPGSTVARKVFGQYGSFTSHGCNQRPPAGSRFPAAPNRYTLCQPFGIAVDRFGTLYIADSINNRVLIYFHAAGKPRSAPADLVLGQSIFSSTASNDVPRGGKGLLRCSAPKPASPCTLNSPLELSLDPAGDLLVPDVDNNRVLLWSRSTLAHVSPGACARRCFIPAARVWGQYGSFNANGANNPSIPSGASARCTAITYWTPASACTLSSPSATLADAQGNLFVADTSNNRVLEYAQALSSGRQDASTVYGQQGRFDSRGEDVGGVSGSSLSHPLGLAFGPQTHLWVSDYRNMRVLEFPAPGATGATNAVGVLGQQSNLSTKSCAVLADALCGPTSIAFDPNGHAFVADGFNNRVLEFFTPPG